ncbi:hypothetical protein B0T18DRAFT_354092 [Schizothecium vesticola]|uniref:Cora-domain-containing protein n=1 Tax=Schizothecium vesticola TaxID=314040 RepID=A0AA40ELA8_9PEZI|nr:hypothetical protein B0T18DRAFT_354092 [Schizothecium vesticola]
MIPPRDGDWLSSPGEYQDLINKLSAADPRLRSRCTKNLRQKIPWPQPNARLVVLEGGPDGSSFGQPVEHDAASLNAYLKDQPAAPAPAKLRRVFILEGLHPDYIASLGGHFGMHPSMFIDHERVIVMSSFMKQGSDTFGLPSAAQASEHRTIKYHEPIGLSRNVQGCFKMCCAETGRHVAVTRVQGRFLDVGVVRRKCTIWRRENHGGGWDCIILTDPPLRTVQISEQSLASKAGYRPLPAKPVAVSPCLFQNGYTDFTPHSVQLSSPGLGPPRTSMLLDLCFYLQHHTSHLPLKPSVDPPSTFARKIIASHYLALFNFSRGLVSDVQFHMSRHGQDAFEHLSATFVDAGQWSDVQALERRMGEYCEDVEDAMLRCDIPLSDELSRVVTSADWSESAVDFQMLRIRLRDVRRRAELLNAAITGLASVSGSKQALREAQSTKALTLVGLVFIPLAYTATLFSMTEPYGPGGDMFWLYFAIAGPLILCVLGGYWMLNVVESAGLSWGWLWGLLGRSGSLLENWRRGKMGWGKRKEELLG